MKQVFELQKKEKLEKIIFWILTIFKQTRLSFQKQHYRHSTAEETRQKGDCCGYTFIFFLFFCLPFPKILFISKTLYIEQGDTCQTTRLRFRKLFIFSKIDMNVFDF